MKRKNFELIRNIMHQMESLRDFFIPPQGAINTLHYPGYVIRLKKERPIEAKRKKYCTKKFARKRCPSQLILSCSLKTLKIFDCVLLKRKKVKIIELLWEENKSLQKGASMQFFLKTVCTEQKDHLRKIKPLWRANCIWLDNQRDLFSEMLSYKLTS